MSARPMGNEQLYQMLISLIPSLDISVREEEVEGSPGGLYFLKGRRFLLINKKRPLDENVDMLLDLLKKEDLSGVFVVPAIRERLEKENGAQ
jgi:hypothetical protein